ncbi:MAG: DUF2461 domain-containing protein [Bryobacteraceae bacterium]
MPYAFPGFPAEGIAFLRSLKKNNRREWFQPRKEIYDEKVKAPMVELITALQRDMMAFAPHYTGDPSKLIYRLYRDTRFSNDKTPYKTHIAASFPRRDAGKHAAAGFYFGVGSDEVQVAGGVYMPPVENLRAIREHVAGHHERLRKIIANRTLRALVGDMHGQQLARAPKGYLPDHPAADLLRYKQFLFYVELDAKLVTTPKVHGEVLKRFRAMTPFIEFLNEPFA